MLASGLNPISSPIMPHSQSSLKRASPDFWVMMVLFVDWPLSSLLVVAMGLSANVLPPTPYPLPLLFWLTNHPPGSVSMFYSTSLLLRWWVRTWLVRGVSWNDGYIQGHVWRQWLCAFCFLGGQWHVFFFFEVSCFLLHLVLSGHVCCIPLIVLYNSTSLFEEVYTLQNRSSWFSLSTVVPVRRH